MRRIPQLENMVGLTPDALEAEIQRIDEQEKMAGFTENALTEAASKVWRAWLERYRKRLSREPAQALENREQRMNRANPKFILRNHLAQEVIESAEQGDYAPLHRLYE